MSSNAMQLGHMTCTAQRIAARRGAGQTYYLYAHHLQQLVAVLEQLLDVVPLINPWRAFLCKVLDCRQCCPTLKPD